MKKIAFWLFGALLFFTPLIFTTATHEYYEFPKMFFVYFFGATIIFWSAVTWVKNADFSRKGLKKRVDSFLSDFLKNGKPRTYLQALFFFAQSIKNTKNKLILLVLLFLALNAVSTIFSSHVYTSLWGYYSRFNGGLISLFTYFGLFYVARGLFKNTEGAQRWQKTMLLLVLTLFPVGLVAIYQHFAFESGARVYSTLGQANWLGAYIAMLLPLVLWLALVGKNASFRAFLGILFLIGYWALWFSYSLSGFLAFLMSMLVFVFLNWEKVKENFKLIATLFALAIFLSVIQPGIWGPRVRDVFFDVREKLLVTTVALAQQKNGDEPDGDILKQRQSPQPVPQNTPDEKTAQNAQPLQISDPAFIRNHVWRGTLSLAVSSPKAFLIGTGPETFPYEFQQFRPAQLNYSSEWNYIINKPHNFYLEILAETGVFSFFSYLGVVYLTLKAKHLALTPALIAFYVSNFFGFPVVATELLFWVFLAVLSCPKPTKKPS